MFTAAFVIAVIPLLWVLITLLQRGLAPVLSSTWWTHSFNGLLPPISAAASTTRSRAPCSKGSSARSFSVPLGVLVAIYLIEYGQNSRFAKVATPSWWTSSAASRRSWPAVHLRAVDHHVRLQPERVRGGALAGAADGAVVVRVTETMLLIVPDELREASLRAGRAK
ncbi:hypothetical protein GCM10020366_71460 [Saccharopolyspora gregorii]|uniref:Uncharacterized protein n=1 Tax=Saccharopolyspora gregorii TaxID=33914 RepID=A0ABP6S387_9PSEU